MLELGDLKCQVVELVTPCEPEPVERPLDGVVAAGSEEFRLPPPRRGGIPYGGPHLRNVDADSPRELVSELVECFHPDRGPSHAGEQQLAEGRRGCFVCASPDVVVHA